jgi:hypothetical protein
VNDLPPEFTDRFAEHNRSCWAAAFLSVLGTGLAWLFFFALFTGAVLVFETVRTGSTDLMRPPPWYWIVGASLAGALLLLGAVDRWRKRYQLPPDRPIIGWHLFPEFLLLPPKMTFAIWDHLAARVNLSSHDKADAWSLLQTIYLNRRIELWQLAQEIPDERRRNRLLIALQLTGWIDLHRGEETWFYRVLSDEEPLLRTLTRNAVVEDEAEE